MLAVDERRCDRTKIGPGQVATGMGADHRVSWWQAHENGSVLATALGHNAAVYRDARYLAPLWGGVWWAAKGGGGRAKT